MEIASTCNRKEVFMLLSESMEIKELSKDDILLIMELIKIGR